MHPRNIYKTPPDFSALAVKYPEFLKISTIDLNGVVRIDFKDVNSLRVLTKCLLHSDFDLNVEIPIDRLIPTVPLRLNYLLWLEDTLNSIDRKTDVIGIDIGTGASCIYALLAAKKFHWKMTATEIDKKSIDIANKNVSQNNLDSLINIKEVPSNGSLLLDFMNEVPGTIDFCMCNPPFYSSTDDIDCARSESRPPPNNARSGTSNEIITDGGEEGFVKRIIKESVVLRDKIRIYTTMLGHKSSLKPLIDVIEALGISQFTFTTFNQGKTTRWGLAWSFIESTNLSKQILPKKKKGNKPLSFIIPPIHGLEYTVNEIANKLIEIFKGISVESSIVHHTELNVLMEIRASKNTWSHQRQKRRQDKLNQNLYGVKRKIEDDASDNKRQRVDCCVEENIQNKEIEEIGSTNNDSGECSSQAYILTGALCVRQEGEAVLLELGYLSGSAGKDGIHQIVQYIRNNWR